MSALNLNKVVLAGRITADPELKQTTTGVSVLSFTLAVNRRFSKNEQGEQQTDFISMVAWRQTAEFISKYFRKGSAICVTGSIQTRNWQDSQGQRRYATEVIVDEAMFVDSRSESGNAQGNSYMPDAYNAAPAYSSNAGSAPNFEELNTDDDLPF
ncbi:MAG: single-stranded DNA-binding protein [Ruminococcaceae bacterium]|nr:single-stranded DNA-binding protein [Oscillospiraceae bacterium]